LGDYHIHGADVGYLQGEINGLGMARLDRAVRAPSHDEQGRQKRGNM
jgi:hypothetical protein